MGIVSQYLRELLAKNVKEHGIVVWYDPDKHYQEFVAELEIPDTKIALYRDSFFELRYELEPLLENFERPRLIVYVPLEAEETDHALAEVEAAGVILRPGQQPPTRNTRLSVIAKNALKTTVREEAVVGLEKQIEKKQLTLADLDHVAQQGAGVAKGVTSIVFGTNNPIEVALKFVASEKRDNEIQAKGALDELTQVLHSTFGLESKYDEALADLRTRFSRYLLATDLVTQLKGAPPDRLLPVRIASEATSREACTLLARNWRERHDYRASYVHHAARIEKELGLERITFELSEIAKVETFLEIEKQLLRGIQTSLLDIPDEDVVAIGRSRQSSFWSEYFPRIQAHWSLVVAAGQVLLEARHIEKASKQASMTADAIVAAYASSDRPWCLLDTAHRSMERRWHNFEFEVTSEHDSLEKLVSKARHRFAEVAGSVTERFIRQLQDAGFSLATQQQRQTYNYYVKPNLPKGKTAYIAVDALRFEMAKELSETLSQEFRVTIEPAIGTVPTITPIGMAALLPNAEKSFVVHPAPNGQLTAEIEGTLLRNRQDRVSYLRDKTGLRVLDCKLEDLLPKPKRKLRQSLQEADLLFITSQEIDALSEGDNIPIARRFMDEILHDLRRACRILAEAGTATIIFSADHGYLFGDELSEDMKIDPPGGETLDLHRRVWIGKGGSSSKSYMRARLSDFGLTSDLEIAVPWNFACFKVQGGAKAYFHGGMSLQELIVPVMTLVPVKQHAAPSLTDMEWKIVPGSEKITTRFVSVQVFGESKALLDAAPPKVRVEVVRDHTVLSVPVSSSYGFEEATGDVQLRLAPENSRTVEPNTVTLMITQPLVKETVSIRLMDALSGVEIVNTGSIDMTIAM